MVRPWHELRRELLRSGTFPAWNPHALTGIPLFANPQAGLFSPFSLPLWVLPFTYAFGVVAALKLWAAAFGTYLLARELRLGFLAGLLAGIAFGFCSMDVVWLMPEAVPAVVVMLPWMLWLVERLARGGGGTGSAIGLACVTAIGARRRPSRHAGARARRRRARTRCCARRSHANARLRSASRRSRSRSAGSSSASA